ncbi:MAG: hypothetical protein C0617_15850 [Desulfuromonas sp.]|uniref:WD40 repeat domain-containing protein n=1 Tax=Desulfuromonas sp. TaxID=892 RepID=UPI000CBB86EC|nr:WD40 repeat domain-containing protein [Desulfuromonas sp.]PLX81809.1 MAG: hypothetical protein C0617_15850 [Desulfuromonas sp.]
MDSVVFLSLAALLGLVCILWLVGLFSAGARNVMLFFVKKNRSRLKLTIVYGLLLPSLLVGSILFCIEYESDAISTYAEMEGGPDENTENAPSPAKEDVAVWELPAPPEKQARGLTPEEQEKKKQIRFALEIEMISPFDVSVQDYFKYELFADLSEAIEGASLYGGCIPHYFPAHSDRIRYVAIAEGRIVSGSNDNTIKVWGLASGKLLKTLSGHERRVTSVAVNNGKIISGSEDNTIKVWDLASGKLLNTLSGHKYDINSVAVGEGRIISGSDDDTIKVWDLKSGKLLDTLSGHHRWVSTVAIGEGRIVSGDVGGTGVSCMIKTWDLKSGKLLYTIEGDRYRVKSVTISGGQIVSVGKYSTIKIWDLKSGNLLHTLSGHKADTNSVVVTEGRIVSGGDDATVKVWDLKSGKLLSSYPNPSPRVLSVATGEGKIVSGDSGGFISVTKMPNFEHVKKFKDEAKSYFLNSQFEGVDYRQALRLPLSLLVDVPSFKQRHAEHALSKYQLRVRNSIKHGKIGERYVPYTTSSYTSFNNDYMMINGEAINYSTNQKHSSSSGGHDEDVYGYKAIYEVKNESKNHYLVQMKSDWTGVYSRYVTGSYGAWSDKDGQYSELKTNKSASSYPQSFVLAPGDKHKYQFELGEEEPADLVNVPVTVTVIPKRFYEGLVRSMEEENTDLALIDGYLKTELVREWWPQLIRRWNQIIQDRDDRFSKANIEKVTINLEYDKSDYDSAFDNPVTVFISSKKPLKVKYETPFATETVDVTQKTSGFFSAYEYRVKHSVKGVPKSSLDAKVAYVWPVTDVNPIPKAKAKADKARAWQAGSLRGKVVECINAGGCTYVLVDKTWVGAPAFSVVVGDTVIAPKGKVMKDYHSSFADRTFDSMRWVNNVEVVTH